MRILIYCQYVWGMGHLYRSFELARAFAPHAVTVVAGGQPVDIEPAPHTELVRLPALFMDEGFTHLISGEPGRDVDSVKKERLGILERIMNRLRPEVVIVELFPFGRTAFQFELVPLLAGIRDGKFAPAKTVCSVRDILVEKKDPDAYERRVLKLLKAYFDLLLVHSDERLLPLGRTFRREKDIGIPVVYTGFIARQADAERLAAVRKELKLAGGEKLIVASAGGGRSGHRLLRAVLQACGRLRDKAFFRLEVFAGPFMAPDEYRELAAMAGPGQRVRRFSNAFLEHLALADLSISLAGYNTCMNLLVTGVPSLVLPYARQREQPLRVDAMRPYLPLQALSAQDLAPDRLAALIDEMLQKRRRSAPVPLNLNGAATAADFILRWAGGGGKEHSEQ